MRCEPWGLGTEPGKLNFEPESAGCWGRFVESLCGLGVKRKRRALSLFAGRVNQMACVISAPKCNAPGSGLEPEALWLTAPTGRVRWTLARPRRWLDGNVRRLLVWPSCLLDRAGKKTAILRHTADGRRIYCKGNGPWHPCSRTRRPDRPADVWLGTGRFCSGLYVDSPTLSPESKKPMEVNCRCTSSRPSNSCKARIAGLSVRASGTTKS